MLEPLFVDAFQNLGREAAGAFQIVVRNFHLVLLGVLVGMFVGAIPGLGGSVGLALLIPFTLDMDSSLAFAIFGAIMGSSTFAGSLTAILFNVPGSGSNAATVLDGYQLTRNGEAKRAIGASAFASATGAIVGLLIFFVLIPVVIEVVLLFGPAQIFWVIIIGLSVIPFVLGDRKLAGVAIACVGLLMAFVGRSTRTGEPRFVYGYASLLDGIDLIPAVIGLFAFAEMIKLAAKDEEIIRDDTGASHDESSVFDGIRDVIRNKALWFRCSIIGTFVGAVPGAGGTAANFISYSHAIQSSNDPGEFGKGTIKGVIAAESSNDSKDGGQLFPAFGLGIPGSASTAVLLGGFFIHGLTPGPTLLTDHLDLMLVVFFGLLFANIITSLIGLLAAKQLVRVAEIPITILFPLITILGTFAAFTMRNSFFDIVMAVIFAAIGLVLMTNNISRVPILIALVLGGLMETNYHLAVQLSDGVVDAFVAGPVNVLLILLLLLVIFYSVRQSRGETNREFVEEQVGKSEE